MERSTVLKFIFVLVIGIAVIVISLYSFFGGDKESDDIEDMFKDDKINDEFNVDDYEFDFGDEDTDVDNDYDEPIEKIDSSEGNETIQSSNSDNREGSSDEEHDYEMIEDFNYEAKYIEQFGEQEYKESLVKAEKIMSFYLKKEDQYEKVKSDLTPKYYKNFKNELEKDKGSKVEKVDSLEVFGTEQINSDEIIVGTIASYDNKTEFFHVVFVKKDDVFLIDNIVSMWGS